MRLKHWGLTALAILFTASMSRAQDRDTSDRNPTKARSGAVARAFSGFYSVNADGDEAVLGVYTTSSGERDTLGLLVTGVVAGSPADRAGIEEGNRIASVNGVNLKLAPEDAGEPDMEGMTTRRLVRELGKVKAGDEVQLSLWKQGRYSNISVKTSAREDLPGNQRITLRDASQRPVVGLTLQSTGSVRDSLGPMVIAVESGGPADKAGIVEGSRIASINGTSLSTNPDDAKEGFVSSARVSRFSEILNDVEVGDAIELEVYSDGAMKTVSVTTASRKDVYGDSGGIYFFGGEHQGLVPLAPLAPMRPSIVSPRVRMLPSIAPDREVHDLSTRMQKVRERQMNAERAVVAEQLRENADRARRAARALQTQQRVQSEQARRLREAEIAQTQLRLQSDQARRLREVELVRAQQRLQSDQARTILEMRQERANQEMQRAMEQLRKNLEKAQRRTIVVM